MPRGDGQAKRLFWAICRISGRPGRAASRCPRSIARQRLARRGAGDDAVRCDLGQRHQHEGALEQPRMRQCQFRLVERDVVIGDQIDVERARSPARLVARSRPNFFSTLCRRDSSACGSRLVSISMQALMKRCLLLVAPGRRGVVRRARQQAAWSCRRYRRWPFEMSRGRRRHCRRARSARQPCQARLPRAGQDHADIVEDRGDRRMRLVHGDPDRADARKRREDRVGHRAGGALQQPSWCLERRGRGRHHAGRTRCRPGGRCARTSARSTASSRSMTKRWPTSVSCSITP